MKKHKKIFPFVFIIGLIFIICFQNIKIISLKKIIGGNLVLDFHTMRSTTIELNDYLTKNKQLDKNKLLIYYGNVEKDTNSLEARVEANDPIEFKYYDLQQKLLKLINNLNGSPQNINTYKDEVLSDLKLILNYHTALDKEPHGDQMKWYNLYHDKELNLDKNPQF